HINWKLTNTLLALTFVTALYLAWEAYFGVKTLHGFRKDINQKFQPSYSPDNRFDSEETSGIKN
ncbi:MAG TPA: hypothetical protein VGG71_03785, partial [Chitinophagaceae bacterium]